MKVKRIIAALLASVCIFSLFSCVDETTSSAWVNCTLDSSKRSYTLTKCAYCESEIEECVCDCHYVGEELCENCSTSCVVAERYLYLDRYQKWQVKAIGREALKGCQHIHTLTMSKYVTTIMSGAFSGCTSLETVIMGENVSSVEMNAFTGCSSLSALWLGNKVTEISAQAFKNCVSLTNVDLTYITEIEMEAFAGCTSLEYVIIGEDVEKIGSKAFDDETEIIFYFLGTSSEWEEKLEAVNARGERLINRNTGYTIDSSISFYSDVRPQLREDYNPANAYWHYVNGVPVKWPKAKNG